MGQADAEHAPNWKRTKREAANEWLEVMDFLACDGDVAMPQIFAPHVRAVMNDRLKVAASNLKHAIVQVATTKAELEVLQRIGHDISAAQPKVEDAVSAEKNARADVNMWLRVMAYAEQQWDIKPFETPFLKGLI